MPGPPSSDDRRALATTQPAMATDWLIGRTIGNYVVRHKLGEGGMGAVYLAEHPSIGKRVASA